jgi:hypothetical protein
MMAFMSASRRGDSSITATYALASVQPWTMCPASGRSIPFTSEPDTAREGEPEGESERTPEDATDNKVSKAVPTQSNECDPASKPTMLNNWIQQESLETYSIRQTSNCNPALVTTNNNNMDEDNHNDNNNNQDSCSEHGSVHHHHHEHDDHSDATNHPSQQGSASADNDDKDTPTSVQVNNSNTNNNTSTSTQVDESEGPASHRVRNVPLPADSKECESAATISHFIDHRFKKYQYYGTAARVTSTSCTTVANADSMSSHIKVSIVCESVNAPNTGLTVTGANCSESAGRLAMRIQSHLSKQSVQSKQIEIIKVGTLDQVADIMTKPLARDLFERLRYKLMGW